ncbi:MAG TPA: phosphoenolpyruvate-utilizing N-terminal domain-containing protein, partial [Gemmataceae bacterium]|nr:phosphoenolpyruvate-utilizing N-terminal domain-containing protein [Gemmataceae bacterium]
MPISPGIAVAPAFCVDEGFSPREPRTLDSSALSGEIARLDAACLGAAHELDAIATRVARQVGEEQAAIFRGHRLLLRDPALIGKVKAIILDRHVDAATALHEALEEYNALFSRIPDDYLKER